MFNYVLNPLAVIVNTKDVIIETKTSQFLSTKQYKLFFKTRDVAANPTAQLLKAKVHNQ